MAHTVELIPLAGIVMNGRTVRLGDTKADVERTLGRPLGASENSARPLGDAPRLNGAERQAMELLGGPDGPVAVLDGQAEALEEPDPLPPGPRWFYFHNELRLDFDSQGRVEFIELLGGPEGELQPSIGGLEVFQAEPETVYDLLKAKNSGPIDIGVNCYSCTFLNLETGIYRERVPEDVTEMIGEARAEGRPLSAGEIDCETLKTRWAAIGIGTKGYYT